MLYADYLFSVEPDGSIFFDSDLSAQEMNIKPGDGFVAVVNRNGTVVLRKIDLTKIEHITAGEASGA